MIEGAYFAMFNEFYTLALQAVKDIDQRAQYELFPDVMLVTSAVINSLKNNSSGMYYIYVNRRRNLITHKHIHDINLARKF